MKQRSPTLEGFRVMFTRPSLGLAEIAWRWTFGAVTILSLTFLAVEYFRTLPVRPSDIFLLRTRHPLLISQALAHIFRGSGVRLLRSTLVLFMLLSAAWIFLASWARTATVSALVDHFRGDGTGPQVPSKARQRSPFGLNLLRVCATVAAFLACGATFVFAQAASPSTNPSPGAVSLVFLTLVMGISLAWWLLNWILSLAAICAVAEGRDTFSAIWSAVDLWRRRWGSIVAAGTWFGMVHTIIFFMATSLVAFPLAFVGVLPVGVVLGGVVLITLLYFAAADFLYAGRMAAYVAMVQWPVEPAAPPLHLLTPDHPPKPTAPAGRMDRDELILSDIPLPK